MSDLEQFGQLFDSVWGWLVLGLVVLVAAAGSHEFRDWRHRRRRHGVASDSGFYIDTGVDNDGDARSGGGGDGGGGDGGGGDGGE